MTRTTLIVRTLASLAVAFAAIVGRAEAQGLSEPVTLVASEDLDGTPLAQTVLVAAPRPDGGHMGFIINRPTGMTLNDLLQDQTLPRTVAEPVFLGGPEHIDSLFVLAPEAPDGTTNAVSLVPGLVALVDEDDIDRILKQSPSGARYFVGVFLWPPGTLAQQIRAGTWTLKPIDATIVFRKQPSHLWTELRATDAARSRSGTWL